MYLFNCFVVKSEYLSIISLFFLFNYLHVFFSSPQVTRYHRWMNVCSNWSDDCHQCSSFVVTTVRPNVWTSKEELSFLVEVNAAEDEGQEKRHSNGVPDAVDFWVPMTPDVPSWHLSVCEPRIYHLLIDSNQIQRERASCILHIYIWLCFSEILLYIIKPLFIIQHWNRFLIWLFCVVSSSSMYIPQANLDPVS